MDPRNMKVVHNQPYDESIDVSDGEEIASNNPTPRASTLDHTEKYPNYSQDQQQVGGANGTILQGNRTGRQGRTEEEERMKHAMMYEDEEEEEEEESPSEEEEEEEEPDGQGQVQRAMVVGIHGYDPSEYDHLQVNNDIKDLFQYITRYTPQNITLEARMRPFIPDYVPAIGDIDAFLKVTRPDGQSESLGLTLLDEPSTKQSDPHVLDLQLRTHAKQVVDKPGPVHSIQDPEKGSKALDSWIENIRELHRQKPAASVHYTRNMPDIEHLMQEWPPEFNELLKEVSLPSAELDCSLKEYVDILCALLDIPVHGNRIHSLHVLFSLYMEFKNSQHFNAINTETENLSSS